VKQGLIKGNFICKYKFVQVHISKKYSSNFMDLQQTIKLSINIHDETKDNMNDYALIVVEPI